MKTTINESVAKDYMDCIARMVSIRGGPEGVLNERKVLFCFARAGDEGGFEHASDDVDMDVVVLGFEPGRESDGPANVAVYEKRNGELNVWPRCQPWVFDRSKGQAFLVVEGQEFGFAYHGAKPCLTFVGGLTLEKRAERVATAKLLLRVMPQFIQRDSVLHYRKVL